MKNIKTYYITSTYENQFPIDFVYSKNPKYIVFQYCRATCNGYLDGETECHSDFIQRDKYEDSFVLYANVMPPDDNRKYEYVGNKRDFKIRFIDPLGNEIKSDNFKVFLKLIYKIIPYKKIDIFLYTIFHENPSFTFSLVIKNDVNSDIIFDFKPLQNNHFWALFLKIYCFQV